uniref:Uncharacterized protein n=1 Tax=Trichobilharzia regenti TaxID=157069 RepID=A0AA85JRY6_TRIRE|nr:unnamed protein product [Trichobilharzia regenti]
MPFEESIKDLKPNKWPTLNFSVEQMKTDLKESTTDENSDDEIDADSSGKKHNTFSSSLLNDTYQTINSNDDDDDDGDSDGDNTDEVNRTTSNTDISKTLAVLNYYYWWLQYMSNEFSHPNQSTNQTMGNLGSSNFSSNGNYTNDD